MSRLYFGYTGSFLSDERRLRFQSIAVGCHRVDMLGIDWKAASRFFSTLFETRVGLFSGSLG